MKICYGILNYNRKLSPALINKMPSLKDVVVCTNDEEKLNKTNSVYTTIKAEPSCAVSKNLILKHAKENKYDYCYMIEDDMQIIDTNVFAAYKYLVDNFGYNFVFYGFNGQKNKVVGNKCNPSVIMKLDGGKMINVVRNVCGGFSLFKITDDLVYFDELLRALENEYYGVDCKENKQIPFNGFFLDLHNSHKFFARLDIPTVRVKTIEQINEDVKVRNALISFDFNADLFFNFIIEKRVGNIKEMKRLK